MFYRILAYLALAGFVASDIVAENSTRYSNVGWWGFAICFIYILGYTAYETWTEEDRR
jgi:hypothetical protein